jgi:hypothetical protein
VKLSFSVGAKLVMTFAPQSGQALLFLPAVGTLHLWDHFVPSYPQFCKLCGSCFSHSLRTACLSFIATDHLSEMGSTPHIATGKVLLKFKTELHSEIEQSFQC